MPGVDLCWDVARGLPLPDRSMAGIFSEHCLEHFSLSAAVPLLKEFRRVLAPGGTLRIVVPDAELYLLTYASRRRGEQPLRFPFEANERRDPLWTPVLSVNRVFYQDRDSPAGHRTMFDFELLAATLGQSGFGRVERKRFGESRDPALAIDTPGRACESLYAEAWHDA